MNREQRRRLRRPTPRQAAAFASGSAAAIAAALPVIGGRPPLDFIIPCPGCGGAMRVWTVGPDGRAATGERRVH